MGSFLGKIKSDESETPTRGSILKRIEDPRSPTDEVTRTPIEVAENNSKETLRQQAFANAMKLQNKTIYESSPIYPKGDRCEKEAIKTKITFTSDMDTVPILEAGDSNISLNVSDIEKENRP